jgi:hypothetical protein
VAGSLEGRRISRDDRRGFGRIVGMSRVLWRAGGPPGTILAGSGESWECRGFFGGPAASPAAGTHASMRAMLPVATSRRGRRPSRDNPRGFGRIMGMSRVLWRAGGLAGRRYTCFDVGDVARCDKPTRPQALQGQSSRVRANRGNVAGLGEPYEYPGINIQPNPLKQLVKSCRTFSEALILKVQITLIRDG